MFLQLELVWENYVIYYFVLENILHLLICFKNNVNIYVLIKMTHIFSSVDLNMMTVEILILFLFYP